MNSEILKHLIFTDYQPIFQSQSDKCVALSNFSICYTKKNIKKSYKNNKFKMSAPTWNEEFKLPDGLYSVLDIQDYFEKKKKNWRKDWHPSIIIYINKIENRITFKIKTRYYLKTSTPWTMKLLKSNKRKEYT